MGFVSMQNIFLKLNFVKRTFIRNSVRNVFGYPTFLIFYVNFQVSTKDQAIPPEEGSRSDEIGVIRVGSICHLMGQHCFR